MLQHREDEVCASSQSLRLFNFKRWAALNSNCNKARHPHGIRSCLISSAQLLIKSQLPSRLFTTIESHVSATARPTCRWPSSTRQRQVFKLGNFPLPLCTFRGRVSSSVDTYIVSLVVILRSCVCGNWAYQHASFDELWYCGSGTDSKLFEHALEHKVASASLSLLVEDSAHTSKWRRSVPADRWLKIANSATQSSLQKLSRIQRVRQR